MYTLKGIRGDSFPTNGKEAERLLAAAWNKPASNVNEISFARDFLFGPHEGERKEIEEAEGFLAGLVVEKSHLVHKETQNNLFQNYCLIPNYVFPDHVSCDLSTAL